jgi:hypothetical protein
MDWPSDGASRRNVASAPAFQTFDPKFLKILIVANVKINCQTLHIKVLHFDAVITNYLMVC